jgi:hypothetical protein
MGDSEQTITDGKTLMGLVTGATRWDFNRDAVDSDDAGVFVDRLYGKLKFSLMNWRKYVDKDREMSEVGLTQDIDEVRNNGYTLVASIVRRKSAGPDSAESFNAYLRLVKS